MGLSFANEKGGACDEGEGGVFAGGEGCLEVRVFLRVLLLVLRESSSKLLCRCATWRVDGAEMYLGCCFSEALKHGSNFFGLCCAKDEGLLLLGKEAV